MRITKHKRNNCVVCGSAVKSNKHNCCSPYCYHKLQKGRVAHNRGIPCSKKQKEAISKKLLGYVRTKDSIIKMVATNKIKYDGSPAKGRHHTEESKKINSEKHTGEKNHCWKGGISFLPYCEKFNQKLKEAIRKRDEYVCQLCSKVQIKRNHSVHHVHYDKENCYPDLITLCTGCNSKVNKNRKHYEELFMNQLNNRELLFWTRSKYV